MRSGETADVADVTSTSEVPAPICRHWARHGVCRHGDACRFVHGALSSAFSVDRVEGAGENGAADDQKSRQIEARVASLRTELHALRRNHAEICDNLPTKI